MLDPVQPWEFENGLLAGLEIFKSQLQALQFQDAIDLEILRLTREGVVVAEPMAPHEEENIWEKGVWGG